MIASFRMLKAAAATTTTRAHSHNSNRCRGGDSPILFVRCSATLIPILLVVVTTVLLAGSSNDNNVVEALNVLLPGGTGPLGRLLIPKLSRHDVTVLSRNAYLASAPNRVTDVFGYLGRSYLDRNPHVKPIRDWDGGDLLEIVGQDFLGWQEDALVGADVIVHLVGGYTSQRKMATERLVRESLTHNPDALHVTVNPLEEEIGALSPGLVAVKTKRIQECEDMVRDNCRHVTALRLGAYRDEEACEEICKAIAAWELQKDKK
jgi:hypothetical protein